MWAAIQISRSELFSFLLNYTATKIRAQLFKVLFTITGQQQIGDRAQRKKNTVKGLGPDSNPCCYSDHVAYGHLLNPRVQCLLGLLNQSLS